MGDVPVNVDNSALAEGDRSWTFPSIETAE
jgi:hypothetical protein